MSGFFNGVSAVIVLILLMGLGYLLGLLGWIGPAEKKFISRFTINVGVPVNCVVNLLNNLDREHLAEVLIPLLSGTVSIALTLVLGAVVAKAMGLPLHRWGVFAAMTGTSNTTFVGLPVIIQLFGSGAVPLLMVYYLPSSALLQTAGVMLVEASGSGKHQKMTLRLLLQKIFTKAPIIGITVGLTLLISGLRPPELVMTAMGYVSGTVVPMAMVYCGYVVCEVGLRNLRLYRGIPTMLLLRLGISPLICLGVCALLGVDGLYRSVFTVAAALPVVSQIPVMSGEYGADETYAAAGFCLSMLGCFVTLPVLMYFLG